MSDETRTPYLDTSALAKWYLPENFSEELESYLQTFPYAYISSLTCVEMRCLLARRRRDREISTEQEQACRELLEEDIAKGYLRLLEIENLVAVHAGVLVDRVGQHALRTLDALHLAILERAGCDALATADQKMAAAADALGFHVERFFADESPTSLAG